jgi:hypothetical protein
MVKHGNTQSRIIGFGNISIQTGSETAPKKLILENVAYVPGFHTNIISVYRLRARDISWDQEWLYTQQGKLARTPLNSKGLWVLQKCTYFDTNAVRMPQNLTKHDLWHKRLGHIGDRATEHLPINRSSNRDSVPQHCEICALSKAKQQISRKPQQRGTEPFEQVHMDIIHFPQAFNHHRYAIHYYCDFTQYHQITTLPSKNEEILVRTIESFINRIEKQGFNIRTIMMDVESGLQSRFNILVDKYGIIVKKSVPYDHQQNGKAERSGGMIITKARCLLLESGLPEGLWPEMALAAVYLLNRSPIERMKWKTPYEAVFKQPATYNHLRIIGSKSYVLIPNMPKLDKLKARARIGYLVGYEASNIWRIWLPATGRVIPARDVTFNEACRWGGETEETEIAQDIGINHSLTEIAKTALENLPQPEPRQQQFHQQSQLPTSQEQNDQNDQNTPPASQELPASQASPIEQAQPNDKANIQPDQITPEQKPDRQLISSMNENQDRETISQGSQNQGLITPESQSENEAQATVYTAFAAAIQDTQPRTEDRPTAPDGWKAMTQHPHARYFKAAAQEEIEKLVSKKTWKVVNRPNDRQVIPIRWVFTYKLDAEGVLIKHKARLCVRGDLQRLNPYEDVYAATAAFKTFRMLMSLAAAFDMEVWQLDAVNAFVNADIDSDVYIQSPEGYAGKGKCLKLIKALYGLRKSPLLWLNEFSKTLQELGLVPVPGVNCLFKHATETVFIFFYVDDILQLGFKKNIDLMTKLKDNLCKKYEMKDMGEAKWFLNVRITRDRQASKLWLTHDTYIDKIVQKFNLGHIQAVSTPATPRLELVKPKEKASPSLVKQYQERIGSLLYPAVTTRPDIAWIASKLSQYNQNPSQGMLQEAERVIAYLNSTKYLSIEYSARKAEDQTNDLRHDFEAASDASFADDPDTRYSSQGYCFKLFGGPIQWQANRQKTITLSTTETELLSLTHASKELQALERIFNEIKLEIDQRTSINCDNQQTVGIINKELPRLSSKLRHIDVHQLWLRQETDQGRIQVNWVPSQEMIADGFTKPLTKQPHQHFIRQLGMTDLRYLLND